MAGFNREKVLFPSADGKSTVTGYYYTPQSGTSRAVIQISHGMCEYIRRYEPMIQVLTEAGFAVCGNDHLGHGDTSVHEDYGFAGEKNGHEFLLKDLHQMNQLAHEKFPGLPCFMLGHSMGSFYCRWYAEIYPETLSGLVISGTGGPNPALGAGKALAAVIAKLRGPRYVSNLIVSMTTGGYCKGLESEGSPHAWLSRDPAVWEKYGADPMCTFSFSAAAYHDMLTVYSHVSSARWAEHLDKSMPILIYSGDQDPVGEKGKGVRAVYELLQKAGIKDLTMKLYPGGRHEMHNETNRAEVFEDLMGWLNAHCAP